MSIAKAAHAVRRCMSTHPIKSTLKAPGTKRLKLNYDNLLSNSAFKFNLRRYNAAGVGRCRLTPSNPN